MKCLYCPSLSFTPALWLSLLCLAAITLLSPCSAEVFSPDPLEFFESRIRPILAQDCYECHSTAGKQKGGLNLDHRKAWQAGGDSGPVIIPGKPEESVLIQAIRHQDEDLAMPKSGAKLEDAIIQDFVQWVAMGAPDPRESPPSDEQLAEDQDWKAVLERRKKWWSFQPIANPSPPTSSESPHPIDQFVEARRAEANLEANSPAAPHVLLRRLTFNLIGLPPSPEQVSKFETAYAENPRLAFANQVDALLASPHFGERWARHWMDWIRYAESHGSEGDPRIENAHLYRDYLIRALNDDVPFDQLVREHIAGDQLESPRINRQLGVNESLIGTAHWRMVFHGFAPTDALDEKVRFTDDQINVFSKAFLGLTVSCARCHDHKFDAISQADYYAFFGIMGSTRPGRKAIDLPERLNINRSKIQALKPKIRAALSTDWLASLTKLEARLSEKDGLVKEAKDSTALLNPIFNFDQSEAEEKTWTKTKATWESDDQAWQEHLKRSYPKHWKLGRESDHAQWYTEGIGLSSGPSDAGAFSLAGEGDSALIGIHPAGTYTHLDSPKHGGLLSSPDVNLDDDYEVWMQIKGANRSMSRYVVYNYPRNGTVYPVREMQGEKAARWHWQRYNVDYWKGDDIHLELTTGAHAPLLVRNEKTSWFGIREALLVKKGSPTPPQNPRRYLAPVFAVLSGQEEVGRAELVVAYIDAIHNAIKAWQEESITDDQAELLDECRQLGLLPNTLQELPSAQPLLARYRELENSIPIATQIPTVAEWQARDQPLFDRGNHKKPLATVPRRFLEAIDATPYDTPLSGRRQLAEDLLREDNPLTRRVIVNRIWHHLFGKGIVNTPDNFGKLGSQPTHPKLLDHLATYFVHRADWSLKQMIRYLVTSRTWQLDSTPTSEAEDLDPANKYITHFNIRRLEAEAIRDSLLHVANKIDLQTFGNPVSGNSPRRSVYVNVIRNRLDPFLSTFDAPIPFSAQGRRSVTTVPGQSLTMMNGNFVVDTARYWGDRLQRKAEDSNPSDLVDTVWRRAFARYPSPLEKEQALAFIKQQRSDYQTLAAALDKETQALRQAEQQVADLLELARQRLAPGKKAKKTPSAFLKPISQWLFDADGQDSIGSLNLSLRGSARIEEGALVLDGGDSIAISSPIDQELRAKTFEVWVQLTTLDQRGGGAMSLQTPGGAVFDSVVFAERQDRRWMAGSNHFARTKDFMGAPSEEVAHEAPIHLALTYAADGTITCYRNGEAYGKPYQTDALHTFEKGKAEIIFGVRHGAPNNGNTLKGKILEARLYDRALKEEEVQAAAAKQNHYVSQADLIAAFSASEKAQWSEWSAKKTTLQRKVETLEATAPRSGAAEVWKDLALAIFNMKEFIYVR